MKTKINYFDNIICLLMGMIIAIFVYIQFIEKTPANSNIENIPSNSNFQEPITIFKDKIIEKEIIKEIEKPVIQDQDIKRFKF
ncbi:MULTISPECIES: hypothetical protein [Candidatus Phytoplasma]|uniref:Effector n=1 Tax=Paulownia witches'-broom phytoplasma TaxID=39647 RepID=A0ABX8TQ42_9MOLU|nr:MULTISPECIES: hypothetical protein [Phytoplasma]QYC31429.1 hypothetical protein HGD80_02695 [Paulownia witches'-broom phytoplasma]